MNVACRSCWLATARTTARNVAMLSAAVSASSYLKLISCCPSATSWWDASISKPISSNVKMISLRTSLARSLGRGRSSRRCRGDRRRVAVVVRLEEEELRLRSDGDRVPHVVGLREDALQHLARAALERFPSVVTMSQMIRAAAEPSSPSLRHGSTANVSGSGTSACPTPEFARTPRWRSRRSRSPR